MPLVANVVRGPNRYGENRREFVNRVKSCYPSGQRHADPVSGPNRDRAEIEAIEAEDIHSETGRIDAFPVEGVDAAATAEMMLRAHRIPLIGREFLFSGQDTKRGFRDTDHQCIFLDAQCAVAGGHFHRISLNLEADCAAMAGALVTTYDLRLG